MKKSIFIYIKSLAYLLIGLTFSFASFYLISNIYHYDELKKEYKIDIKTDLRIIKYNNELSHYKTALNNINLNNYQGTISKTKMVSIQENLKSCLNIMNTSSYEDIQDNKVLTLTDIYNLREDYENKILSDCVVSNLYWISIANKSVLNSDYLISNQKLMTNYIELLRNETTYLEKDLLNTISYSYNTNYADQKYKNFIKDGFDEVISSYDNSMKLFKFISDWYLMEVDINENVQ